MKQCSLCQKLKPSFCFSFRNKKKGQLMTYCKECSNAYQKAHYLRNRDEYLLKHSLYHKKIDRENRERMVEYLLSHPCTDCQENDIRVLEFDHIGKKSANIATMLADSVRWEKIMEEVSQCEVRCANCHKKRTAGRENWYKNSIYGAIV